VPELGKQPLPQNIEALHAEVARRWGTIDLLDFLKEADYHTGFTDEFASVASREVTPRPIIRKRLLLALHGLATNIGIKRITAAGAHGETEATLRTTRRLYINRDNLRRALARLLQATLAARDPSWWGQGTACASDSKKFGSWSSNFMTEYHARYSGNGVMIYWHVEKKSLCVYSQLRSCSASEVAAMIEGVLRHCTSIEIDRNYVDTHGQSLVGFAFAHLLGFRLLPRFKTIGAQKLGRVEAADTPELANLAPMLTSWPIDWELISQQYDQMVKYATALRLGTAEAEQGPAPLHPRRLQTPHLSGTGRARPSGEDNFSLRVSEIRRAASGDPRRVAGRGKLEQREHGPVLREKRGTDRSGQGTPRSVDACATSPAIGTRVCQYPAPPADSRRRRLGEAAHHRR
jgi:Tn3 transposase DDE domain